jgi:hypothetical protein
MAVGPLRAAMLISSFGAGVGTSVGAVVAVGATVTAAVGITVGVGVSVGTGVSVGAVTAGVNVAGCGDVLDVLTVNSEHPASDTINIVANNMDINFFINPPLNCNSCSVASALFHADTRLSSCEL